MSWLTVVALGPHFATKAPRQLPVVNSARRILGRGLARVATPLIALPIAALGAMAAYAVFNHPYRDDATVFFKPDAEILASEQRASSYTNDFEPGRFIVITGSNEDEVYRRHALLLDLLASQTNLHKADLLSLLDWVPPVREQQDNFDRQALLYGPKGALAELYRRLELVENPQELRREYKQAEGRYLTPADCWSLSGRVYHAAIGTVRILS